MVSNFLHVTLTEFPEICLSWEVDTTCADKNKPWSNETVFPCYNSCERHRVISNQDKTKAFACRIPVHNNLIFYAKVKVECHDTQIPNLLPFYFPNCSIYFQTSILIFDFLSRYESKRFLNIPRHLNRNAYTWHTTQYWSQFRMEIFLLYLHNIPSLFFWVASHALSHIGSVPRNTNTKTIFSGDMPRTI